MMMSESKFQGQPGPWKYNSNQGRLVDATGQTICNFWSDSKFSGCTDAIHGTLCAAAPDLLAALQEMWNSACTNASSKPSKKAFLMAQAAITKALSWESDDNDE
ncbi:hypothetical protein H8I91_09440 [Serratia fonticola]|uniref:hypothetical protein n=1 Tax=Serratia fonticola TaxID=47917 RepID=UPI00164635B0|nr:hypothetical protein [Serratia fonticola]MBC3250485.1 hypothetical protein [Serratia fonticola]